ncbi:TPA: hypothetical protein N0F65_011445 [Lagenidium giganteum]|uniref:Uncharacterized protein n=1 Tax=Lagenidium giganteum TaxID=4803 RepID=A0AAV2ZDS1_9STRA|nr:TPA: hypothetical protein N0F65_011445 [Lagenidium giganteum]
MEAWNRLSEALLRLTVFSRRCVNGKKVQNRFLALLERHKQDEQESALGSGLSETYPERRQLLDTLVQLVADHRANEAANTARERKRKEEREMELRRLELEERKAERERGNAPRARR